MMVLRITLEKGCLFHASSHGIIALLEHDMKRLRPVIKSSWNVPQAYREVEPPTPEELQHFAATAIRYGYWLATPEENAAVGLTLF
jgi:hypothetical protein